MLGDNTIPGEGTFELGNQEKGKYTVNFGNNGDGPSFFKDGEAVEEIVPWTQGLLTLFGYEELISDVNMEKDKEKEEIILTGDFGSITIKKNGGLEYEKKILDQDTPEVLPDASK
ncbi:MAG: hypothetical protein AB9915_03475 [Candidatus Dojkabacteria bacterium]